MMLRLTARATATNRRQIALPGGVFSHDGRWSLLFSNTYDRGKTPPTRGDGGGSRIFDVITSEINNIALGGSLAAIGGDSTEGGL